MIAKIFQKNKKTFWLIQFGILLFPISNNYRLLLFGHKAEVYADFRVSQEVGTSRYGHYTEYLIYQDDEGAEHQVHKPEHIQFDKNEKLNLLYSSLDYNDVLVLSASGFFSPFNLIMMLIISVFWAGMCITVDVSKIYNWMLQLVRSSK